MKKATKIQLKKAQLDVLENLLKRLNSDREDCYSDYRVVGKTDEQKTDWRGNLVWEDEAQTIPVYRDRYDYVTITEDEMTEEQIAKLAALDSVISVLEKMI